MKHSQFRIGKAFYTSGGRWLCTDIGTRTVVAVSVKEKPDKSWLDGPPYAVAEVVFDEYDLPGCSLKRDTQVRWARTKPSK
jgi:hypothetical protein